VDRRYRQEIEEILARLEREQPDWGTGGRGRQGGPGRGGPGDPFSWLRALAWRLTPGSVLLTILLVGSVALAVVANLLRPYAPPLAGSLGLAAGLAFLAYYILAFRRGNPLFERKEVRWRGQVIDLPRRPRWGLPRLPSWSELRWRWRIFLARFRQRW
jgi:hypothetical protein